MRIATNASRVAAVIVALLLFVDAYGKLAMIPQVVEGARRLGYAESSLPAIGALLAACTLLYLIPRTSVIGVVLLTGYLGGAVATKVRVGESAYSVLFPVVVGVILWAGVWVRDERLRGLMPLRTN